MKRMSNLLVVLGLLSMLFGVNIGMAQSAPPPPDALQALEALSGGKVVVDRNQDTGLVRYIGTDLAHAVASQIGLNASAAPGDAALQFAREYAGLFGVSSPDADLQVERVEKASDGQSFVRYQQTFQGIPVLAGELIVHLDKANRLLSMNGEALDANDLDTQPKLDGPAAQQTALATTAKAYGVPPEALQVSEPTLWVYNPRLIGAPSIPLTSLVWRMDVTGINLEPIKELVLVDAHSGAVRLHFNQIDTVLSRTIYDKDNVAGTDLPGATLVRSEGGPVSGITDADYAYDFAGQTYNFYFNILGRDSVDNAGLPLVSTVRYCPYFSCPTTKYQNAFWNGDQMVYGDGFASADDVVAHELTHGVTQYTSGLFYYMQSGAINESLSDIFGEFVDQSNNSRGTDSPATKWRMGEDLSGFPSGIRSMSDPTLFNDPDKITSPKYSGGGYGNAGDNGGVHHNSGILNKAAYLITDGDTFNGQTVTGLGINKAALIFYTMQINLLTPGSDYNDVYNLLPQACTSLVGTHSITSGDCDQVVKAVTATEMNLSPLANGPVQVSAACPAGKFKTTLFSDGFETAADQWETAGGWYLSPPGYLYPNTGTNMLYGYDGYIASSSVSVNMINGVSLPTEADASYYLHFAHAFDLENGYDGGVVEYSLNGGAWTAMDAVPVVNGPLVTLFATGNPLGNRLAFSGVSHGYQTTRYDLTTLAGSSVRFRWRLGVDSIGTVLGWFLDDVSIYRCAGTLSLPNKIFIPAVMR